MSLPKFIIQLFSSLGRNATRPNHDFVEDLDPYSPEGLKQMLKVEHPRVYQALKEILELAPKLELNADADYGWPRFSLKPKGDEGRGIEFIRASQGVDLEYLDRGTPSGPKDDAIIVNFILNEAQRLKFIGSFDRRPDEYVRPDAQPPEVRLMVMKSMHQLRPAP